MYEISSDSDEDRYDRFPQKLQKLKNKHALNNLLKVVDNSKDIDSNIISINGHDSDVITVLDANIDCGSTNVIPIELDTPSEGISKRSKRSKRRKSDSEWSPETPLKKGGKRKERGRGVISSVPSPPPRRGRSKGRGRIAQNVIHSSSATMDLSTPPEKTGRGRRQIRQRTSRTQQAIVTYSVGNTDEYPDALDDQVLFSNKNVAAIKPTAVIDLDESLDNEEISVKVYWQHSEVFKFNIRRLQKLTQIFDFFINKEGVSIDRLLFTYNYKDVNKILRPDDTPESIDYNIAKFIEGGIVNKQFSLNTFNTPVKKGFMLKFQCQNRKKPVELIVGKDDKLKIAMMKCAESLEIPIAKLVFEFDGETIQGNTTPNDLDMDSGDCIDVKILNNNK